MKDLTMTREILLEKTAFIRGKFYSVEKDDPTLKALHEELFKLSNEILSADEKRLSEIDIIFSFADKVIAKIRGDYDESK